MTDVNEQAQRFGPTLSSVLAQSETAERELSVIVRLGREAHMYIGVKYIYIYIYYGTPLVHDTCVRCVVCACAAYHGALICVFYFLVFQVEAGWRRKLDIASWDGT